MSDRAAQAVALAIASPFLLWIGLAIVAPVVQHPLMSALSIVLSIGMQLAVVAAVGLLILVLAFIGAGVEKLQDAYYRRRG